MRLLSIVALGSFVACSPSQATTSSTGGRGGAVVDSGPDASTSAGGAGGHDASLGGPDAAVDSAIHDSRLGDEPSGLGDDAGWNGPETVLFEQTLVGTFPDPTMPTLPLGTPGARLQWNFSTAPTYSAICQVGEAWNVPDGYTGSDFFIVPAECRDAFLAGASWAWVSASCCGVDRYGEVSGLLATGGPFSFGITRARRLVRRNTWAEVGATVTAELDVTWQLLGAAP